MRNLIHLAVLLSACGESTSQESNSCSTCDASFNGEYTVPDASIDASVIFSYEGRVHAIVDSNDNIPPFIVVYDFQKQRLEHLVTQNGTIVEPTSDKKYSGLPSLSPNGMYLLTTQRNKIFNSEDKYEVHLTNLTNGDDSLLFYDNGNPFFSWADTSSFFVSRSEIGEQGPQTTIYRHNVGGTTVVPYVSLSINDYYMPVAIQNNWLAFYCPKEPTDSKSSNEICYIDTLHGFQNEYVRVTDSQQDGFVFDGNWLVWSFNNTVLLPCKPTPDSKYAICSVNLLTNRKTNVLISEEGVDLFQIIFGPYPYSLLSSRSMYNLSEKTITKNVIPSSFKFEGDTISPHLTFFAWEK